MRRMLKPWMLGLLLAAPAAQAAPRAALFVRNQAGQTGRRDATCGITSN